MSIKDKIKKILDEECFKRQSNDCGIRCLCEMSEPDSGCKLCRKHDALSDKIAEEVRE